MTSLTNGRIHAQVTTDIIITSCAVCGAKFGVPDWLEERCRADHNKRFWCPACGSNLVYKQSKVRDLELQLERAERARKHADARAERNQREADHQHARAAAYKGHLTKTKNRIAKGVCPCCQRSFANLARHMAGQHPGYAEAGQ